MMTLKRELCLIAAALALAACSQKPHAAAKKVKPATVDKVEGSKVSRVTLSEHAAQRLRIETAVVRSEAMAGSGRRIVVPYAAVLYDADGVTWVYASPESLRYIRQPITIDFIDGDRAVLSSGPPVGTSVVTVGALQLFGAEFEIGH